MNTRTEQDIFIAVIFGVFLIPAILFSLRARKRRDSHIRMVARDEMSKSSKK